MVEAEHLTSPLYAVHARTIRFQEKKFTSDHIEFSRIFTQPTKNRMASRKHDLLNVSTSEDESDRGYDSEDNVAESKGRAVKRRKTADQDPFGLESDEGDSDISEGEKEEEESRSKGKGRKQAKRQDTVEDEDEEELDDEDERANLDDESESINKLKGKLVNKKLAKLASGKPPKKDKSGVVYLSSLPPYLKPVSATYSALKTPILT